MVQVQWMLAPQETRSRIFGDRLSLDNGFHCSTSRGLARGINYHGLSMAMNLYETQIPTCLLPYFPSYEMIDDMFNLRASWSWLAFPTVEETSLGNVKGSAVAAPGQVVLPK